MTGTRSRVLSRANRPRTIRQWPQLPYFAAAGAWRERVADDLRARSIVVNGAPRSGTTWLGDIVTDLTGWPLMQEPTHAPRITEAVRAVGWDGRPYRDPDTPDADLVEVVERICIGTYLGPSLIFHNRRNDVGLWRRRPMVTKHITLNLLLPWIATQMPWLRIVQIVRHPLEVVASQMGREGSYWAGATTLSQPYRRFMAAHPEHEAPVEHPAPEDALVTMWAMEHAWLEATRDRTGNVLWVRYEDLRRDPGAEAQRIARWAGLGEPRAEVLAGLRRPSRTVEAGATTLHTTSDAEWRQRFDDGLLRRLRAILDRFGNPFYGEETLR